MSSDRELTHIVRSWLDEGVTVLPDRVLDDVLAQLPLTSQRRPWWRAWRTQLMNGTFKFAAAGLTVVAVAAIGLAVYLSRPSVVPSATQPPNQSPSVTVASPTQPAVVTATDSPTDPTLAPQPTQAAGSDASFILFVLSDHRWDTPDPLWAMRADGSDAHEIYPALGFSHLAWSQDGKRLLVATEDHVYLSEVANVIGPFVDTGFDTGADTACADKSTRPMPCQDGDFTFAPDGQRVAFLQSCTWNPQPGCAFITILDLRTGELTELSATLQQGRHKGPMGGLAWSPDGAQIAFTKETEQGQTGTPESNLWLIDADGQNLHQVDLPVARLTAPQWSPDGETIALVSDLYYDGVEPETQVDVQNIYTVRPDGTDFRQLTTDDNSSWPEWTLTGQIRFRNGHLTDQSTRYSLMDADGSHVTELIDLNDLFTEIVPEGLSAIFGDLGRSFLWQPSE